MRLGDTFLYNENYEEIAQFCRENNYIIANIGKNEDGKNIFQIKENKLTNEELLSKEYNELRMWFNNTYSYQEQKYRRLITLNKLDDDGIDANEKLIALYDEAEEKRKRIQNLEAILDDKKV